MVGGLGGFRLELCSWLVERGARYLSLVSCSGISSGYQSRCVREWREAVVKVTLSKCDITFYTDTIALLSSGREVGGVFNLAMVYQYYI